MSYLEEIDFDQPGAWSSTASCRRGLPAVPEWRVFSPQVIAYPRLGGNPAAVAAGLPLQEPRQVRETWPERMDRAREVLDVPSPVWRRWQTWLADDSYWPEHSALIHGDLHPAHILVDGEHRVTGLLDWTEAQVADPATDFTLQYATLGHQQLGVLLESYRKAGGRTWPRMHEHIAETWSAYPAVIAMFALLTGEDGPRQLGQTLVDANARELAENVL